MILTGEERKKVLERMEKLMAHNGEGAVNVNEIATASKKIKELIDEYGVSIEEIKGLKKTDNLVMRVDVETYHTNPKRWMGSLAVHLSDFYDCRCIQLKSKFCFIGFDLDVQATTEMFNRLYPLISRVSRMSSVNLNDFSFGVVISLGRRLKQIKLDRTETNITALVIVKKDSVDEEVGKLFPRLTTKSGVKLFLTEDYKKGLEYGKTIELFKGIK